MATVFPLPEGPTLGLGVMHGWRITSTFGARPHPVTGRPGNHSGMDLAWYGCTGQPIYAPCAGRVSQSWDPSGGGNWTGITGHDGCYWGLGHAARFEPGVNGAYIEAGRCVGYVGSTGASTGAHLHAAYRAPGASRYSDPHDLLAAAPVRPGGSTPPPTGDWFAMATEADLKRVIDNALVDLRRDLNQQANLLVDGRPGQLAAWLLSTSAMTKRRLPNQPVDYPKLLGDAIRDGRLPEVRDLGMRSHGDPYIAMLDLSREL